MGRSTTPKYALVVVCPGLNTSRMAWHVKPPVGCKEGHGAPTAANLEKYVDGFVESLKPGGANRHLFTAFGDKAVPNSARIVHNDGSGRVVAEWKAPMFWVTGLS